MKKFTTIFILLILSFYCNGQISLGYDLRNNKIKSFDEDEILKKFKDSETIFIFSNFIDKNEMENILKKSWTVTPFKVINESEFNINNYLSGNFSFATYQLYEIYFRRDHEDLKGITHIKSSSFENDLFLFFMIDKEDYLKNKEKETKENKFDLYSFKRNYVSSFLLSKNPIVNRYNPITGKLKKEDNEKYKENYLKKYYEEDFLYDNKPGFLMNNFQKINFQILNETKISAFSEFEDSKQLSNLKSETLYIPNDLYVFYDQRALTRNDNSDRFKRDYDYLYNVTSADLINQKILNNEEFYYLRFNLLETEKMLQVVNSKTGEVIYSRRFSGMMMQLPGKAIKNLNKEIKKS